MTVKEYNEQLDRLIDEYLPCKDIFCDGTGTTVDGTGENPIPAQCQYCYQLRMPFKLALQQLNERACVEARLSELVTLEDYRQEKGDNIAAIRYLLDRIKALKATQKGENDAK